MRVGGGLNARSSQTPNRNPPGIVAPQLRHRRPDGRVRLRPTQIAFKLNVINVTNKLYADSLYTGHYIPGQPRTVYATDDGALLSGRYPRPMLLHVRARC